MQVIQHLPTTVLCGICGVANDRIEEVITAVLAEFALLKSDLVPQDELNKVKNIWSERCILDLNHRTVSPNIVASEVLHREIKTPKEKERRIRAVTSSQVMDMARKIL